MSNPNPGGMYQRAKELAPIKAQAIEEFKKREQSKYWNKTGNRINVSFLAKELNLGDQTVRVWYNHYLNPKTRAKKVKSQQEQIIPVRTVPTFEEMMEFQLELLTNYNKFRDEANLCRNQLAIAQNEIAILRQDLAKCKKECSEAVDKSNANLTKAMRYKAEADRLLANENKL